MQNAIILIAIILDNICILILLFGLSQRQKLDYTMTSMDLTDTNLYPGFS